MDLISEAHEPSATVSDEIAGHDLAETWALLEAAKPYII